MPRIRERKIGPEVVRIFAEAQRLVGGDSYDHAAKMAPWRDVLPDGTMGPEYLPTSPVTGGPMAYDKACAEYHEGRFPFSEGLFDHAEDAACRYMGDQPHHPPRERRALERKDSEALARYMAAHSHEVAPRELEVYIAFWVEGRSYSQCASYLKMAVSTAKDLVKQLRSRVHKVR